MRFSIISLATSLLLAGSALAGYNCKCQDANGQYNQSTEHCCEFSGPSATNNYYGGSAHQCYNNEGGLDSGRFVECCQYQGHGGAFCWR